ncbi:MAG: glycosyl transferase [Ferruginibacter sp.]|jgi:glycosyltransferase involved in cell wall biosynthesis|uniref:glycosyltransferase n=1 Tax=Ferruginibacter sp. TaxID=1940288 RepID=UPI002659E57C|nr:glycosyltransferase [Ferruginibacter sp.]MDB5279588.1 glycosyl transferase [Ferruginibacter sp.]
MERNQKDMEITQVRTNTLICFSHLRWDFVYQRPQHLMSRLNKTFQVYYVEEPIFHAGKDSYVVKNTEEGVIVVTPLLNDKDTEISSVVFRQKLVVSNLLAQKRIEKFIAWYYTPMALKISSHLKPELIVYDCMDELSAFKFAPAELKLIEAELLGKAAVVFTGGQSLYKAKKLLHDNIFAFPSSIDKNHFQQARQGLPQPADQSGITGKRFGFYGVIDERFNIALIDEVASLRPDWQFVLVGPIVKINPDDLPRRNNIHYLGGKSYAELPSYLAGWDIAIIPFEKNESTKFISPTKTPEYLAGGKPVISASITDVVTPYADMQLVSIADTAPEFIKCAEQEFSKTPSQYKTWLQKVDRFLEHVSWDNCVDEMMIHINLALDKARHTNRTLKSVA